MGETYQFANDIKGEEVAPLAQIDLLACLGEIAHFLHEELHSLLDILLHCLERVHGVPMGHNPLSLGV
jgi:hypothetical protein